MTLAWLSPGTLFASRWIVGRVLGKNALAVVYEAEESREARFAALKLFDSSLIRDTSAWARFEALTRKLAQVPGEGIARSYDVGVDQGRPFVATERSTFPTLSRYVAERGALSARDFRETLATLARALDAAHGAAITHGNLKPQNVFVSRENTGWARLTDFGLADLREANGIHQARTLGWNAPEVSPGLPTPESDLFALGLLAFFALSGNPYYSAQRTSTASGVERPRTASERAQAFGGSIPAALDGWFERALAHDPKERFATALDMTNAFAQALDGLPDAPKSVGPLSATVPVPRKSPLAAEAYSPSKPPESKLDPNGPTAPHLAMTEAIAAQAQPPFSNASRPPAPQGPSPTLPLSVRPSLPATSRPTAPPSTHPMLLALGAFVVGLVVLGALTWMYFLLR